MGGDLFVNGCLLIIHLTPDNAAKQLEEVMVRFLHIFLPCRAYDDRPGTRARLPT